MVAVLNDDKIGLSGRVGDGGGRGREREWERELGSHIGLGTKAVVIVFLLMFVNETRARLGDSVFIYD